MRTAIVATFTVLAASGCVASVTTEPVDDEPPPSSARHVEQAPPSEKDFAVTKPGDPRPATTSDAWPDVDPKSDPDVAGFAPDFPGGPSDCFGFPMPPTG